MLNNASDINSMHAKLFIPSSMRQTRYRVRISSWPISSWTFELNFRVRFRVGFSNWTFELDFRVWISSWTFQQEASADVTADLDTPPHFFYIENK